MSKRIRLIISFLFVAVLCACMLVPTVALAEDTDTSAPALPETLTWEYSDAFVYDGEEKTVVLADGQLDPNKYTVEYEGNVATDAGDYTASAVVKDILTSEEVASATLEWKVAPFAIDLSEIVWDYVEPFVYSGSEYSVSISSLPELIDPSWVTVTGASATAAGKYNAKALVTLPEELTNYTVKQADSSIALNWEIVKADYDMSGVSFNNKSVRYNSRLHTIALTGTLPSGVTVSYNFNGAREPGVYPVTATFKVDDPANYNTPAKMTAELHIRYLVHSYPADTEQFDVKVETLEGIDPSLDFVVNSKTHNYLAGIELDGKMMEVLCAYDVCFTKGGDNHQIDGDYTLSIRIPKQYLALDDLYVVHITDNGELELIDPKLVTRDDRILVLNVDSFSVYAIVTPVVADDAATSETDDALTFILIAILAVLIVIAIAIFLFKRNHLDDGPETTPDEPITEPDTGEAAPEEKAPETTEDKTELEKVEAEQPTEEPGAEQADEEETASSETTVIASEESSEPVDAVIAPIPVGEAVPVRYRSSFQSRLIQSDEEIQGYYSAIKNKLLSYKGVKSRTSWNFESFNKTKVQCAKLNIKGKAILLYINLNTDNYSATKYHFQNVADTPKFADVPMLLKVKSERGLKYALELIEELMRVLEIPEAQAQDVDYRVPYESNEELAKRGLVKVILPKGMELSENMNLVELNVSELLDDVKTSSSDED